MVAPSPGQFDTRRRRPRGGHRCETSRLFAVGGEPCWLVRVIQDEPPGWGRLCRGWFRASCGKGLECFGCLNGCVTHANPRVVNQKESTTHCG
jgi:hypothetical protein